MSSDSVLIYADAQLALFEEAARFAGGMGPGESYREQMGVVVAPLGRRGQIDVRLHLANEVWPGDPPESSYETTLHLLTTYPRLAEFSTQLRNAIEGANDDAVLKGERID